MKNEQLQTYLKAIERELLGYIIVNLKNGLLSHKQAQELARDFLTLLPAATIEDLLENLFILSEKYKEAKSVFAKYGKLYDEEKRRTIVSRITECLQQSDIDTALSIAKGGIYA